MHPTLKTPYIFAEARHLIEGAGFIIETTDPWYIARILTFKDNDAYLSSLANSTWPVCPVRGYRIILQFSGSLVTGTRIDLHSTTHARIENTLKLMAGFYEKEKIDMHKGYYKKFLITSDR